MKGVIVDREELNLCLEFKPLHVALLAQDFKPVNFAHSGRVLYVTYGNDGAYRLVQWQWDADEGWKPFLYADRAY